MKKIAKAKLHQINKIWQIRKQATKILRANEVDQWQYKDPSYFSFVKDILFKRLYVLTDNKEVVGMILLDTKEETYNNIDGNWKKAADFIVIHKLGVKYYNKGYAKSLMLYAEHVAKFNNINYIRIDTHEDNKIMINLLKRFEYEYRGIINLKLKKGDNKRLAYDKEV